MLYGVATSNCAVPESSIVLKSSIFPKNVSFSSSDYPIDMKSRISLAEKKISRFWKAQLHTSTHDWEKSKKLKKLENSLLLFVQRSHNWRRDCARYMFGKLSSRRIEWYGSRPHKSKDDRGNQGNVKKWRKRAKIATLWGTITHAPQTFSKSPLVFV